jgi:predicted MFS family arabinose efflux permease
VAGAAIAPPSAGVNAQTCASVYAMVDGVAPDGTVTEAFAWLATAMAVGTAAGASVAGVLVEQSGPAAAFVLAGIAGAVALVMTIARAGTLAGNAVPVLT